MVGQAKRGIRILQNKWGPLQIKPFKNTGQKPTLQGPLDLTVMAQGGGRGFGQCTLGHVMNATTNQQVGCPIEGGRTALVGDKVVPWLVIQWETPD